MKTKKSWLAGLLAILMLPCAGAQERKRNVSSSEALSSVRDVAGVQGFPDGFRVARMGSVLGGGRYFHIFTTWLKDNQLWRTLVFDNSGNYLGYYETKNEPVELEKTGIIYPGNSYNVESGDVEEGVFDSGDAHIIRFSTNGPPDIVKFEQKSYTFVSSPKRVRPDASGFRYMVVASRMVDLMNKGRYSRIREDFSPSALAKLPDARMRAIFANLRQRVGKVERLDPPWVQADGKAVFPITFEKGVLGLELILDDLDRISGLRILPYKEVFPDIGEHRTPLALPFGGRWCVLWGGDNRQTSKYFGNRGRHYALEFVIANRYGKTYSEEGERNEDYFAFGRPVGAPADGVVVEVINNIEDNKPHSPNPFAGLGNVVVIQHATNEVSVLGHLMHGSITVSTGDVVKVRQPIARCGNSGDSSQPSIYFHLQDSSEVGAGTGYRPVFRNTLIWEEGRSHVAAKHTPVRGEYVAHHSLPAKE